MPFFQTKDTTRIHTELDACQRLSIQLVSQLNFIFATVKRWDSCGHNINVHATRAIPQTAALNKKAAGLCDDELFLQRRFEQATINLKSHWFCEAHSISERPSARWLRFF